MDTADAAGAWIASTLIGPDGLFVARGFASSAVIYRAALRGSFLASLINGVRETASFAAPHGPYRYNELVRQVGRLSGGERAFWIYVTDPDNCLSVVNWVREAQYDTELDQFLPSFETDPAVQGGTSRLLLVGSSTRWLLLHEYQPKEEFTISFHGPAPMCRELCRLMRRSTHA